MKRLITLLALAMMLVSLQATAQVPRTALAELGTATW
jgi:hypothetical protein